MKLLTIVLFLSACSCIANDRIFSNSLERPLLDAIVQHHEAFEVIKKKSRIEWVRKVFEPIEFPEITRLVYGYAGDDGRSIFLTNDTEKINEILAAWLDHTEEEHQTFHFSPVSEEAPVEGFTIHPATHISHGCTLAIRLYADDNHIYTIPGHFEETSNLGVLRNEKLHRILTKVMPKKD